MEIWIEVNERSAIEVGADLRWPVRVGMCQQRNNGNTYVEAPSSL